MTEGRFKKAIVASLTNGDRLGEDAERALDSEQAPTAYALAVIAQEEYAKACS